MHHIMMKHFNIAYSSPVYYFFSVISSPAYYVLQRQIYNGPYPHRCVVINDIQGISSIHFEHRYEPLNKQPVIPDSWPLDAKHASQESHGTRARGPFITHTFLILILPLITAQSKTS